MALRVIGAGLGRMGTMSLKVALEKLGFTPCYHMAELVASEDGHWRWLDVLNGKASWDTIFEGFLATTDYPACNYWRELAGHYPDAKVVLTVRDPDAWFDSVNATILSDTIFELIKRAPPHVHEFFQRQKNADFLEQNHNDRAAMTDYFRRHNREVIEGIAADRLLVYEVAQGWEPLCEFLGLPIPDEPFPRVNERAELESIIEADAASGADFAATQEDARQLVQKLREI